MNHKPTFGLGFALCLLLSPLAHAQTSNDDHQRCHHHRMGPFGPWSEPTNLGPVVNSEYNDITPGISPDGLSLYFDSNRPGGIGAEDIWVSHRDSVYEPWGSPVNVAVLNSTFNDGTPTLPPQEHGLIMYFHSARPSMCRGPAPNGDIYVTHRADPNDDFSWETPQNLGCLINTPNFETGPAFFRDRRRGEEEEGGEHDEGRRVFLYYAWEAADSPGLQNKIYVSRYNDNAGMFGAGVLVPELSSPLPFNDTRPTIRMDGLEFILASNRPGTIPGPPGAKDLWVSTRRSTIDRWSDPVNMGTAVNTEYNEAGPQLSADGQILFFSTDIPGGFGGADLYVTTRSRLCDDDNDDDAQD
jgi:WD40 repeat protein